MRAINFTEEEINTISMFLETTNPCKSGCIIEEMQNSNSDCDKCKFHKIVNDILIKLE